MNENARVRSATLSPALVALTALVVTIGCSGSDGVSVSKTDDAEAAPKVHADPPPVPEPSLSTEAAKEGTDATESSLDPPLGNEQENTTEGPPDEPTAPPAGKAPAKDAADPAKEASAIETAKPEPAAPDAPGITAEDLGAKYAIGDKKAVGERYQVEGTLAREWPTPPMFDLGERVIAFELSQADYKEFAKLKLGQKIIIEGTIAVCDEVIMMNKCELVEAAELPPVIEIAAKELIEKLMPNAVELVQKIRFRRVRVTGELFGGGIQELVLRGAQERFVLCVLDRPDETDLRRGQELTIEGIYGDWTDAGFKLRVCTIVERKPYERPKDPPDDYVFVTAEKLIEKFRESGEDLKQQWIIVDEVMKPLVVAGKIKEIELSEYGGSSEVILAGPGDRDKVVCRIKSPEAAKQMKQGQRVTIVGDFEPGFSFGAATVYLNDANPY
ncbi:MAG: hypothetical protein H8E44_20735 [Planctomycetes bacterium]|nr:hypothetical protein [Planctomycetota bacterium]